MGLERQYSACDTSAQTSKVCSCEQTHEFAALAVAAPCQNASLVCAAWMTTGIYQAFPDSPCRYQRPREAGAGEQTFWGACINTTYLLKYIPYTSCHNHLFFVHNSTTNLTPIFLNLCLV